MNLALATDLLLVTPDAVLDSGFLARGIHPGGGHLALLGRRTGYQQATAMALLGRALSGIEAVERGLAYAAFTAAELLPAAKELVALAAKDPQLTRRVKQSLTLELGPGPSPGQRRWRSSGARRCGRWHARDARAGIASRRGCRPEDIGRDSRSRVRSRDGAVPAVPVTAVGRVRGHRLTTNVLRGLV